MKVIVLRHALVEFGFFSSSPSSSTQTKLLAAWFHFKSYCKRHGITCSQPPFKENMVS